MSLGLLILRLALGGAMLGHAGRHLFGWAGGNGFARLPETARQRGFRLPAITGPLTGLVQLAGGLLIALGLLDPVGPVLIAFSMLTVLGIEWGKPFFVTQGGNEHAWLYLAMAIALGLAGPGNYSLDAHFGISLERALGWAVVALGAVCSAALMLTRRTADPV